MDVITYAYNNLSEQGLEYLPSVILRVAARVDVGMQKVCGCHRYLHFPSTTDPRIFESEVRVLKWKKIIMPCWITFKNRPWSKLDVRRNLMY